MRLCVIGDPVGHSLSPLLHRRMLDRAGLTGSYETVTVTPDTLPEFLAAARDGAWDGCNVTMPLKQAVLPLLDELDPAAAACGAVNTVCFRRGRAVGYNTDAPGIRAGLLAHGADLRAGQVLNKLYEDNALGTIPQDRYEQMSQKYSEEYYTHKTAS